MEKERKLCPLCGGDHITKRRSGAGWYIGCNDCDMGVSTLQDPEYRWNTRPIEDALRAEVEQEAKHHKLHHEIEHTYDNELVVLRAEIARLQAEVWITQEWIPVSERLPNEYCDKLVFRQSTKFHYSHPIEKAMLTSEKMWYSGSDPIRDVTHWMPLPEPPG